MRRFRVIAVSAFIVGLAACSPSDPGVIDTTTSPATTGAPGSSTTVTAPVFEGIEFVGTAPVLAFVAGSLWDLSTSPASELATLPADSTPGGEPVMTPYGIVISAADTLWLVAEDGSGPVELARSADSFAVAADQETVAWAETTGVIGEEGSQTRLVESTLPDFTERSSITVDGFARVVGYAGDLVMLETGDGAGALLGAWVPGSETLTAIPGYMSVLGTNRADENAVLTTFNGEARWVVAMSDGRVFPEATDPGDQPWGENEAQTASFSPDGTLIGLGGLDRDGQPSLTIRAVSTRAVVTQMALDGLPGSFFSPAQIVWVTDDAVIVLAETWQERSQFRPHAGWRFIYQCSVSAETCESLLEIRYEPTEFYEIALVTVTAPPPSLVSPLPGWRSVEVDQAVFGNARPTAAASREGTLAVAGCHRTTPSDWFPLWWSRDAETWTRAEGPPTDCLLGIVDTGFGLSGAGFGFVAWGFGGTFVSQTGSDWEPLEGPWVDEPGWTQFVSTYLGVTTVLRSRAAQAESTVATLWTTTDGETWESRPADIFDNADVAEVIVGGSGLIAVGASPGGQFVPTAAVWTSTDGIEWRRVTPPSPSFAEATMFDVMIAGGGFIAAGTDWNRAVFWRSLDGITWIRADPTTDVVPEFGSVVAQDLTVGDGLIYATGFISDANADGPEPRMWTSTDGFTWESTPYEEFARRLPFDVTGTELPGGRDVAVAFWPPPHDTLDPVVSFFVTE